MAGEASIRDALTRTRNRVGHYRILAPLGAGGMGVVYLAEDEVLGRRVALKLLAPGLADSPDFRDRFVRESRLAASIEHPGIVPIYEAGEADGTLFIAMRLVDGPDLRTLLAADGPLAPARAADLVAQVAAALDAAHAVGLVHRDVKPANVMIDRAGGREHCYLTDFGLTKNISATSGYTSTGQVVGTLSYVAPEQIQGGRVSARADVYSLGCVLFECLTGSVPFRRDHDVALMYAHMQDPPPQAHDLRPELPAGIDQVLARALAKAPEDRQPSCGQLAVEARAALAGSPVAAFEPSRARTPRFARPSPVAPTPPAAAAPPPPRAPVVMPLPVQLQPPPPPRGGRHLRAAAIVAAAILLCAGGIAAALVLHHNASSKTSDAQRILDETIALNNRLLREANGLRDAAARDAEARQRLIADEKQARDLLNQAKNELREAASVRATIVRAARKDRLAANRLQAFIAHPEAIAIGPIIDVIQQNGTDLVQARGKLSSQRPGHRGSVGPVDEATKRIRLPSGAVTRITGNGISSATGIADVNGDGRDDVLVVATSGAYVVFGGANGSVDVARLGDGGFAIKGAATASPVGDVNGDGKEDVGAIGFFGEGNAPVGYVVYGTDSTDPVRLPDVGSAGVEIALPANDPSASGEGYGGPSVTAAGDVNDDGSGDLLVGDPSAPGGGAAWVVYGGSSLGDGVGLDALTPDSGFAITSGDSSGGLGSSVDAAGDVDDDGVDDVVVGAPYAAGGAGAAYVVYGSGDGGDVDVSRVGDRGFEVTGAGSQDAAGATVVGLGDFTGDGHDDVLVGAPGVSPHGRERAGAAYVIRGPEDAGTLGGGRIEIDGPAAADPTAGEAPGNLGASAAAAGDAGGGDAQDVVLGTGGLRSPSAAAYVVYGGADGSIDLRKPGGRATAIEGDHIPVTLQVGGGQDLDGDGRDDVLAVLVGQASSEAYVVSVGG